MSKVIHTFMHTGKQEYRTFNIEKVTVCFYYGLRPANGFISGNRKKIWFGEDDWIIDECLAQYVYEMVSHGTTQVMPNVYEAPAPKKTELQLLREKNKSIETLLRDIKEVLECNKITIQRMANGGPRGADAIDWIQSTLKRMEEQGL